MLKRCTLQLLLGNCLLLLPFFQLSAQDNPDRQAIMSIMDRQVECWNQADLDCFMEGYWHSDALMYIGKNGVTYGYEQALKRYQKNYPDQAAMGRLTYDIISLEAISKDAYFMVGKWHLKRQSDERSGHFTLIFRKKQGQWVITKDHSS